MAELFTAGSGGPSLSGSAPWYAIGGAPRSVVAPPPPSAAASFRWANFVAGPMIRPVSGSGADSQWWEDAHRIRSTRRGVLADVWSAVTSVAHWTWHNVVLSPYGIGFGIGFGLASLPSLLTRAGWGAFASYGTTALASTAWTITTIRAPAGSWLQKAGIGSIGGGLAGLGNAIAHSEWPTWYRAAADALKNAPYWVLTPWLGLPTDTLPAAPWRALTPWLGLLPWF